MQRYGVVQPSSKTISSPRETTQSDEQTIAPLSAVQILRSSTIDLSSLRLDAGVIEANVFAWTAAFHPTQAKVAVATQGCITEYDVVSGCKMDAVELPQQTPVNLQYLGDNVTIAFVTKERHLMTFNWSTRRLRTLYVAGDSKGDTHAMTHMHLAVYMGTKPVMFVSKHGSQAVRMVLPPAPRAKASDGKGKGKREEREKEGKDGLKCYLQQKKPIIGIAPHPALDPGTTQLLRAALKAERHPFNPRSSLLVSGTNTGALSVWEVPDSGEPRKLGHFNSSDGTALIGAGIISGNLTCKAWRINATPSGGTLLIPLDATPSDVWAAVDGATPALHAEGMTEAAFWTSLRSTQHASSFAQFQGNARHGYDVARIVIHPQGYLMAQMLPLKELLPLRTKMAEKIDAGSLEAVQRVMHAPVMRLWDAMHPPNGSITPDVVPLSLSLEFWTPQGDGDPNTKLRLIFPKDVTMLDAEAVRQYNLMGDSLTTLAQFPKTSNLLARRIVHSEHHKAWLIFFSAKTAKNVANPAAGDSEYTLILQSNVMQLSMGGMDTAPGLSGTFCGANDDLFAVLANDLKTISIHQTLSAKTPIAVVQLPGAGGDSLYNAGVLMAARGEVERPHTPEEQEEDKKKKKKKKDKDVKEGPLEGQVWFLWSRDGALELGDAAAASGRCSFGAGMVPPKSVPVLGAVAADRSMLLNATEKVLQVAWQPMGPQAGSLVHPQGTADHSCLGAVVTTERLVVLDGDLQLMASNRPLEHHVQVLSCVWAGPALFFSTSAEEVYQFGWGGTPLRCFALSNGSPCTLAGALVDRLLVSTRVQGVTEVMSRFFDMGPALLVGWAGLAASGAMADGVIKARRAMVKIVQCYDTSGIEPQQLAALADSGFADIALQIVRAHFANKIDGGRHAATVERCQGEARALMKEYEASPHHPRPPPRGGVLFQRLVRCGRKSTLCCAFSAARNCFAAAGQVLELVPILVALNDKPALRSIAEAIEVQATMTMDCTEIASMLYAAPPHVLNAVSLDPDPIGNSTYDGSFNQVWGGEDVAPPGTHPAMLAAYSQNDRGSILPLDRTALKHWVEVETVHLVAKGPPGAQTSRGPSEPGTPPPEFEFEEDNTTPHSGNTPGGSFTMQDNEKWSSDDEDGPRKGSQEPSPKAQAARPDRDRTEADSSDDDAPAQPKFRITIKSKDEAAKTAGNVELTRAAQSLRGIKWAGGAPSSGIGIGGGLPVLPAPVGGFASLAPQRAAPIAPPSGLGLRPAPLQPPPGTSTPPLSEAARAPPPPPPVDGTSVDALLDFMGGGNSAAAAPRPPTPTGLDLFSDIPGARNSPRPAGGSTHSHGSSAASVGGPSGQALEAGTAAMTAGNYDAAGGHFKRAWDGVAKEAMGGSAAALETFSTLVQAMAAARLMLAAARATPTKAARYGRFAAATRLPDDVRVPVVRDAVKYNMRVGNYGVANELLLWLVTVVSGKASAAVLDEVQQQLAQCDAQGGTNTAVQRNEDPAGFAAALSVCRNVDDLDKKLKPVLTG